MTSSIQLQTQASQNHELYSLTNLLEQSVRARDLQVLSYIMQQTDQSTIESTLADLESPIKPFILLVLDIASSKSNLASSCYVWLKAALRIKNSEIKSDVKLKNKLKNCHLFDKTRHNRVETLLRIKKKLDLVLNRRQKQTSKTRQNGIAKANAVLSIDAGSADDSNMKEIEQRTFGRAQVVVFENDQDIIEEEMQDETANRQLFELDHGDFAIDESIDDSVSEDDDHEEEFEREIQEEKEDLMRRLGDREINEEFDFESEASEGIGSDEDEIKFQSKPKVRFAED